MKMFPHSKALFCAHARVVRPAGRYKLHADEWMPSYQVSRRMKSPVVWYLLTSLLRVLHAGLPDPSPGEMVKQLECSNVVGVCRMQ